MQEQRTTLAPRRAPIPRGWRSTVGGGARVGPLSWCERLLIPRADAVPDAEGLMAGHICASTRAARVFQGTWLVQHLAREPEISPLADGAWRA